MDGVILYADDDVLKTERNENKLFNKFNDSSDYFVLPVTNIDDLEKVVKSISTFRALVLDWNFQKAKLDIEMPIENENPLEFLKSNKIYSIVCIYSGEELPDGTKKDLREIYGNKIFFETKDSTFNTNNEFEKICTRIDQFEANNKHMEIPFVWIQTINKSAQDIFFELEQADHNWIKEIKATAERDGSEPCSEVVNIFQSILHESLLHNADLRSCLNSVETHSSSTGLSQENTAKLYQRLFYTKIADSDPIMTGDIFKFTDSEYGILITPECEIYERIDISLDFLIFSKEQFGDFLQRTYSYNKESGAYSKFKKKEKLHEIYNNGSLRNHILPSFPFDNNRNDLTAYIDFKTAFAVRSKAEFETRRLCYKLNSPYIHQLRQRYIAFWGRYGVPAIPDSLRIFNLT